jgi:hypothetical protein
LTIIVATGMPAWPSGSKGGFKSLALTTAVRAVPIVADNDAMDEAGARTQCWRTLGHRVCCGGGLGDGRRRNVTTTTRKKFTRHNPSRTAKTPRRHRIGYPARPPDRVRRRKAVRGCALRHAAKPGDDAHTFPGTIERTVSWPLNAAVARVPLVIQSTITDRLPRLHPTEAGREPRGSLTVPPDVPARLMQPAASGGFSGGWPRAGCELVADCLQFSSRIATRKKHTMCRKPAVMLPYISGQPLKTLIQRSQ